jgi:hypothetical protein
MAPQAVAGSAGTTPRGPVHALSAPSITTTATGSREARCDAAMASLLRIVALRISIAPVLLSDAWREIAPRIAPNCHTVADSG